MGERTESDRRLEKVTLLERGKGGRDVSCTKEYYECLFRGIRPSSLCGVQGRINVRARVSIIVPIYVSRGRSRLKKNVGFANFSSRRFGIDVYQRRRRDRWIGRIDWNESVGWLSTSVYLSSFSHFFHLSPLVSYSSSLSGSGARTPSTVRVEGP